MFASELVSKWASDFYLTERRIASFLVNSHLVEDIASNFTMGCFNLQ